MAWLLVPLQYLFLLWRAENLIKKAAAAAGTSAHKRLLAKSAAAVADAEVMQRRFPVVTDWVDRRRSRDLLRKEINS